MANTLAQLCGYALLTWLIVLGLVIALGMLRGDIPLQGLLTTTGGQIDPERVQSLLVSLFVLGTFIVQVVRSPSHGSLPEIPESLVVLFAGSNGLYLSGKIARTQGTGSSQRVPRRRSNTTSPVKRPRRGIES